MRIEIDKQGHLLLERGGRMKDQYCPHDADPASCGDWCPLFHEPHSSDGTTMVDLCRGYHWCDDNEFTDRRGKA